MTDCQCNPTQLPVDAPQGISREPWFALAALLLALAAYSQLASLLMPASVTTSSMSQLFMPELRAAVCPKPRERFLYLFGLACIPTLPTLFYWLLTRRHARFENRFRWLEDHRLSAVRDLLVVGAIAAWLCFLTDYSEIYLLQPLLSWSLLVAMLLLLLMRWEACWRSYVVCGGLALMLLLFLADLLTVGEDRWLSRSDLCDHFDLLLGAVNQTLHGRTVLVDTVSQYGILYPYVAALILAPFKLTAWHVEMFFAAMGLAAMIFLYLAVARKTGLGSPLSLVFFVGILGVSHPFVGAALHSFKPPVVYYQYFPLRVVCGSFFLWFVSLYFSRKSRGLMIFGYAAAGTSLLWNGDTGAVILIAWTGTLLFDTLAENASSFRKILRGGAMHVLLCGLTLLLAFGLYGLFAWLRSGQFANFEAAYLYQRIFFAAGYFTYPMNPREIWQPLMLVYLVTIFLCMRRLLQKNVDATVKWYFFIALYGLGIFSYYQGRSHIWCLSPVVYPAAMLSGFLAVDRWRECRSAGGLRQPFGLQWCRNVAGLLVLLLLPGFGIVSVCRALPTAVSYAAGRQECHPFASESEPVVQFLQKWIGNSRTVIFSPVSNYLHIKTNSYSALPFSSPTEIMLLSQVQEVQDVLDRDDLQRVVIRQGAFQAYLSHLRFDKFRTVAEAEGFRVLEKSVNRGLSQFSRREEHCVVSGLDRRESGSVLLAPREGDRSMFSADRLSDQCAFSPKNGPVPRQPVMDYRKTTDTSGVGNRD
jgi:hypothetical protein